MANTDSTTHDTTHALINAVDLLSEAQSLARFVQGIAINAPCNESIQLSAQQLAGFGCAMEDMIDRVKEAAGIIDGLRGVQRTDNTRVGGAKAGLDTLRNIARIAEVLNRTCDDPLTMEKYWQIQDGGVNAMVSVVGRLDPFMTGFLSTMAEYVIMSQSSVNNDVKNWEPESVFTEKEQLNRRLRQEELERQDEIERLSAETI